MEPDDPAGRGDTLVPRLWRAFVIAGVQAVTAVVVLAIFIGLASSASSEGSWAGVGYLFVAMGAVPLAAVIAALVTAARMGMPLYGLYALPTPLAGVAAQQAPFIESTVVVAPFALFAATIAIAMATAQRPRRGE